MVYCFFGNEIIVFIFAVSQSKPECKLEFSVFVSYKLTIKLYLML